MPVAETAPTSDKDRVLARAVFSGRYVQYHLWMTAFVLACTVFMIPLLIIILPIVAFAKSVEVKRLACELTPRSLKVRRGVLTKIEQSVPLDKITDLAVRQNLMMRWLNIEAISVETAGQSSVGPLVQLIAVDNAREFRDAVLARKEALEEREARADRADADTTHAEADRPDEVLLEIRDALLRIEATLSKD